VMLLENQTSFRLRTLYISSKRQLLAQMSETLR
jgi:hypothetical protein